MAVDDNSPKTGEPQAPSGGDESSATELNTLPSASEKMQVGLVGLQQSQQPQQRGGGGGGRRKQNRPMRLVCSLIDTVDPQSEDDTAAVPDPPSMTADYPDDAADYCIGLSSPPSPREDGVTDLVVRRRHHHQQPAHHACQLCSHIAISDADLLVHCRVAHGRKSSLSADRRGHHGVGTVNRRRSDDPDDDAVEVIDGDDVTTTGDNDDVTDDVEFPTRYHRLGSELKREVETADIRLERIHADAVRKLKTMMSKSDQHHQRSSAVDFQQSADFDAGVGYSYPSHQQQQHFRSRHQAVDENSYGTALDFTVQSRANTGNGGSARDSPASSRQQQQQQQHHHALPLITSSASSMFSSDLPSTTGSEQLRHQATTVVAASQHGHHHNHQHHHQTHQQPQQQQQQQQQMSHHRSSYSSSAELPVSASTVSGGGGGTSSIAASPAVQVDSEDYCDRCQKHFCNKYYLRKHRQDVHGIAPSTDVSSTSAANMSSSASTVNAAQQQQQQHFNVGYPSVTAGPAAAAAAAVQQLLHQQSGGDSASPVLSTSSSHASVLPYQQLINSLPFILPYQQSMGLPGAAGLASSIMSSGSLMFQPPSTPISSMAGGLQSTADSTTAAGMGQSALAGGGLLPGLTSLMLLNPFAILNSPSFLAAAAGMNHLTASSSLNTLAELQKSGGGGLFTGGLDDGSLSMAGLLPPFVGGGPSDHQSSLLSPPPSGQQPPPLSGPSVEDFSSSPSSTSSTSASFVCDLCRKEFCSSYYLTVHQRDKHGITSAGGDMASAVPSSTSASSSPQAAAAAAAAMVAAAGLRLPSTALSDAIRLLAASNGRTAIDGALGLGMMGDGVEPGEKVSSNSTSRGGKQASSYEKSNSGGRGSGTGSLDRLNAQLLGAPPTGIGSSGPDDVCCLCKKQFPNRYGLVLHLLSAHNIRPEGFGLAGELLQLDGLLSTGSVATSQHQSVTISAGNAGSSGRSMSRSSTGNMGSMSGLASSSGGGSQTGNGSTSTKQSDRVSCDICNKEVCNKYFLKTHKIKVHGVDSSVAAYVPPQQQPEAAGRSEMQNVTPPVDSKSGRGGSQSSAVSMKHEDMRKGLMLADSQLNSFAAHLDLALKKDSFGLAGLGLGGLGFGGPPGSSSDRDHQPMLPFPPPSMSASDLFRLFSAVGGAGGKPDDPFGLAAFGLGPAMKSLGLPELTDQLAATMAAAAAAGGGNPDGRSRSASSSLNDLNIPKHPSSSSSSIGGGLMTSSYYKDAMIGGGSSSSNHGGLKNKMSSSAGMSGGKHSKEHHHMKSGSSSSSANAGSSAAVISSSQSTANQLPSSMDRQPLSEQDLIQSGIDPEAYCELCQKEFCSKYFLRTHRQKIHGVVSSGGKSSSTSAGGAGGANESSSSAGGSTNAMVSGAFDHYLNLAGNPAAGLPALAAGAAMPLLPLFQGLSLPPVSFCAAPPQRMLPPDAAGLLSSAEALGGHGGLPANNISTSATRSSGSREAANATRVTCEVCGKELCNKYFLKTHMAKIHGSHPSTSSAQSSSSSSSASSVVRENSRDHSQMQNSASGSSSTVLDAATFQRLDGSDHRKHESEITSGRVQATGNEVDLLAPSAFQSLVGASGSRGSPTTPTTGHQQPLIKPEMGSFGASSTYRSADNDCDSKMAVRRYDSSSSLSLGGRMQNQKQEQHEDMADVKPRRHQLDVPSTSSVKYGTSPDTADDLDDNGMTLDLRDAKQSRQYGRAVVGTGSVGDDDDICSDDEDNEDVWQRNLDGSGERDDDRDRDVTKRKQSADDNVEIRRKRSRTDAGEFSSSSSSSSSENYRVGQHSMASSAMLSSESGENGLLSGRGVGHSVEFLQHQLLLSKLASELHARSITDLMSGGGGPGDRVQSTKNSDVDAEDESKTPVSALLQRHIQQQQQQQQQQLLLQQQLHQFPSYRGSPTAYDHHSGDDSISPDGGRSKRSRGAEDALQRFLATTTSMNGHSSSGVVAGVSPIDGRRTSPSSAAVVDSNGSTSDVGSAGVSGVVGVSSPTCRLFLPPAIGRSGRDQVGIDFSLAGSGRTTAPQQAD